MSSTGGITNDNTVIAGLNRDTTKTQVITKDTVTGALDVSVTVDNRLITSGGRKQIAEEREKYGITNGGLANTIKEWSSSKDENGNSKNDGKYPNPFPGLFLSKSETGKDFVSADQPESDQIFVNGWKGPSYYEVLGRDGSKIKLSYIDTVEPSGIIYKDSNGSSHFNQYDSNPALQTLWHTFPFFKSFTQTHDNSVDNGNIPNDKKTSSIPPYLIINTIGTASSIFNPGFYKESYQNLINSNKQNGDKNE